MKDLKIITIAELTKKLSEKKTADVEYCDDNILLIYNVTSSTIPNNILININVVALCKQGKLSATTTDSVITLKAGDVFVCKLNQIIDNMKLSSDFACDILCITKNGLRKILGKYAETWTKVVILSKKNVVKLNGKDVLIFENIMNIISLTLNAKEKDCTVYYPFREKVIQDAIKFGMLGLCNKLSVGIKQFRTTKENNDILFSQFIELLRKTNKKHHTVTFYAENLHTSPKQLNYICKKNSGMTTRDWIREYTLDDINYFLLQTNLSMGEISKKIGFPNTTFFAKYVKHYLGMTPMNYRDKNNVIDLTEI